MALLLFSMSPCCPCAPGLLHRGVCCFVSRGCCISPYLPLRVREKRPSGGGSAGSASSLIRVPGTQPSSQPGSWRSGWYGGWQRRRRVSYASCPRCFRPASTATTKEALVAVVACVLRHRLAAFRHVSLCLSACLFLVSPSVCHRLCRSLHSAGFLSALVTPSG